MGSPDYTTEHQKGKHLTYEDYVKIQVRLQDGWSANRIAVKELHCSPNTVRKIIRQGMTPLYHGKVQRFKAKWLGKFTKRIAAAAVVHTRPKRKRRFFPTWNPIFVEMTNGRWMPALATLWPTTCLSEARCIAPKLSTTMWNLGCLVLKTSICRRSCIVAPKQKESGSASVYWDAALRNARNPLIPERNSGIGRSMK